MIALESELGRGWIYMGQNDLLRNVSRGLALRYLYPGSAQATYLLALKVVKNACRQTTDNLAAMLWVT